MVRGWTVRSAGIAAAGLVLLIGGVAAAVAAVGSLQQQGAYASAPTCAVQSAAIASNSCRYTGSATVVILGDGVNLAFAGANRSFPMHFSNYDTVGYGDGDQVQAELWSGRVTLVNGVKTDDNPDVGATGWEALGLALLLVGLGPAAVVWAYRRRRDTGEPVDLGAMNPVGTSGLIYRP